MHTVSTTQCNGTELSHTSMSFTTACKQKSELSFHYTGQSPFISMGVTSGGSRISHRGGRGPVRGGVDLRSRHFLAKMYAKMKELGPVGGACAGHAPQDPPMVTILFLTGKD